MTTGTTTGTVIGRSEAKTSRDLQRIKGIAYERGYNAACKRMNEWAIERLKTNRNIDRTSLLDFMKSLPFEVITCSGCGGVLSESEREAARIGGNRGWCNECEKRGEE